MTRISKCSNKNNCLKAETCYRVHTKIEDANYFNLYNKCYEENGWMWYWEYKKEIIAKKEGNE